MTQSGSVWTETPIFTFNGFRGTGSNGGFPGALVMDHAGNLYGPAQPDAGYGEIFEISPQSDGSWIGSIIHRSNTFAEGETSVGPFVLDSAGNLYGVTSDGGSPGAGTVFELSPSSAGKWTFTKLHDFAGGPTDGYEPLGGLIIDTSGNLYGTTQGGGTNPGPGNECFFHCGTVFELSQSSGTWTEIVLANFSGVSGYRPLSTLLMDASGNLYGTTEWGGGNGFGTAFKLSPVSGGGWKNSVLFPFKNARDGGEPSGNLVMDASGSLYGTGSSGGSPIGSGLDNEGNGVVFQLTPPAN